MSGSRSRRRPLPLQPCRSADRSSPRTSPRSSARWFQGYLESSPGRNPQGKPGCKSTRNLGLNLTCYSARNRTRNSTLCPRSDGGSNRTSSLGCSPGSSLGRDFGSNEDSYGGGIGGVGERMGPRRLGTWKLGPAPAGRGICSIRIFGLGREPDPAWRSGKGLQRWRPDPG
jgi:hypothetical protein